MSAEVCTRRGAPVLIIALAALVAPATAFAQSAPATFKVAYFNVQSGKGEPALPGRVASFVDTANCTDTTQPLNAWGTGFFQEHLVKSIKNDPKIVAMGLGESWPSVCASPENIRKVLGWKSKTSSQNGVAMVAKYGFVGAEEWVQLDTSLNTNPADTMWALRMTVCLNETCSQTISVFTAHWLGAGTYKNTMVDRQAKQTVAFMQRTAGLAPHVFTADLNAWEGVPACGQNPNGTGLNVLRGAGYVDAWPLLHGSAEGFTGMTNRVKCGFPEGYGWKRPDYTWAAPHFLPVSMTRFGIVTPGEDAPSDHYGLITEFPMPGAVPTVDVVAPSVALASPSNNLAISGGSVVIAADAADDSGVTRVEIIEDGVVAHTLTSAPYQVTCASLTAHAGTHTVAARAFDAAGNAGVSDTRNVVVSAPDTSTPDPIVSDGDIVLYAKDATLVSGKWQVVSDTTAAGGARAWIPDASAPKLGAPMAAPADFFELTFNAEAGKPYRLWLRGRADNDYWGNDSAFFQFSGSVTSTGAPVFRIGSDSATWLGVEDCSGCAIRGWGWQDNGYGAGVLGPLVYFAVSGPQTVRVQRREDGLSIDQIVLSPAKYLTQAPGSLTNDATIVPQAVVAPPVSLAEIVITASTATKVAGTWRVVADTTAAGGVTVGNPDAGAAKVSTAAAAPANYVEFTFNAEAGREYRFWMRGRADRDGWANDSVFIQFDGSTTQSGQPVARLGSTDAFSVNLEDGANAGLSGWGWQDTGYGVGVLGPLVSFATTGPQTVRIQTREDGMRFDQIVLSSAKYLTTAPGALKNDTTIVK